MGTIRYDYDTAAVRTEARKLKKCFDRLNGSEIQRVKNVRARLDDGFEGSAAAALDGRLTAAQRALEDQLKRTTLADVEKDIRLLAAS